MNYLLLLLLLKLVASESKGALSLLRLLQA
jgi:hypothetical protein